MVGALVYKVHICFSVFKVLWFCLGLIEKAILTRLSRKPKMDGPAFPANAPALAVVRWWSERFGKKSQQRENPSKTNALAAVPQTKSNAIKSPWGCPCFSLYLKVVWLYEVVPNQN